MGVIEIWIFRNTHIKTNIFRSPGGIRGIWNTEKMLKFKLLNWSNLTSHPYQVWYSCSGYSCSWNLRSSRRKAHFQRFKAYQHSNRSWTTHIERTVRGARKIMKIVVWSLSAFTDRSHTVNCYKSVVRSKCEYCCSDFETCQNSGVKLSWGTSNSAQSLPVTGNTQTNDNSRRR